MDKQRLQDLKRNCIEMRKSCLQMAEAAGESGMHFGGTLSLIEIIAALYLEVMNIDKDTLQSEERDRLILSKGHGVPAVYAVLQLMGIISEADLRTFKHDETFLYGHPSMNQKIGIEFSSGSLGQGLSLGVGTVLGLKHKGNSISKVFVILGDGECDEGSVWEAAMSASQYKLNQLMVIVDRNHLQYDGDTEDIMAMGTMEDKWKSFGWEVRTVDGHDLEQCCEAFSKESTKPVAVIADTVKGKGISFMENQYTWHHAQMTKKQTEDAWKEVLDDRI